MNAASLDHDTAEPGRDVLEVLRTSLAAFEGYYLDVARALRGTGPRWVLSDRMRSHLMTLQGHLADEIETVLIRAMADLHAGASVDTSSAGNAIYIGALPNLRLLIAGSETWQASRWIELALFAAAEGALAENVRRGGAVPDAMLERFMESSSAAAAEALSRHIVARGLRRDPYGAPRILLEDLGDGIAASLLWEAAALWRADLAELLKCDAAVADDLIERGVMAVLGTIADARHDTPALECARYLLDEQVVTPERLAALLDDDDLPLFVAVLAELAEVPIGTARRVILEPTGLGLAVLCRSFGMTLPEFWSLHVVVLPLRALAAPTADRRAPLLTATDYSGIQEDEITRSLRYLRRAPMFVRAIERNRSA